MLVEGWEVKSPSWPFVFFYGKGLLSIRVIRLSGPLRFESNGCLEQSPKFGGWVSDINESSVIDY